MKHILNHINDSDGVKSVKLLSEYIHGNADDSFANTSIRNTFGVNIHDAANMLYYQEKFFSYQFPYLSKYLEDLKVAHSLVYYKYANLMSVRDIFSLDIENKRDPSVIWTGKDLEYTGNRSRDILNPYNCFYRVNLQLSLDNSDNHTLFLLKVSDEFGLGDCFRDKVVDKIPITITLDFNDIQCRFYEMVDKLIRLAHRYL